MGLRVPSQEQYHTIWMVGVGLYHAVVSRRSGGRRQRGLLGGMQSVAFRTHGWRQRAVAVMMHGCCRLWWF